MKRTKTYFLFLTAVTLLLISSATQASEPDTIWTIGAQSECWFSPDGTRIIEGWGSCYDVNNGNTLWDYLDSTSGVAPNGYFSQDSLYFYDIYFAKYRISDGVKITNEPDFKFDTLPDFFVDSSLIWSKPEKGFDELMLPDENTFFYLYSQDYLTIYGDVISTQSLICKYDKALDSIVKYVPLVKGTDTLIEGSAKIIGYVSQNNTILVEFDDDTTYRQYNVSNLDSASQFIYDREKYGRQREQKISYNGKYLGFGTTDGESKLGWIVIYDLTNNSLYNNFLERDSTEYSSINRIAFSRNDSFLVSTSDMLRESRTKIWNFHTGTHIHTYDFEYTASRSIDVSPDNTKIIAPNGLRTSLLRARWTPVTSVEDESDTPELMLVYPNPAGDYVEITIPPLERGSGAVSVYDVLGQLQSTSVNFVDTSASGGQVRIDISSLSPGVYFVQVGGKVLKFVKM